MGHKEAGCHVLYAIMKARCAMPPASLSNQPIATRKANCLKSIRAACDLTSRNYLWLALLAAVVFKFIVACEQPLRTDELLHLHDAWMVSQGMLPYRDFFEHHACWYHFAMAPVVRWFSPETSVAAAESFLIVARSLSATTGLAALGILVWMGWRWINLEAGLLAGILVSSVPYFAITSIETRPDVPAIVLQLASSALLFRAFPEPQPDGDDRVSARRWARFLGAGICLGAGVMFTQKLLFVLPGLAYSAVWWWLWGGREQFRQRLGCTLVFALGLVAPIGMTWLGFALLGAGIEFVDKMFLINARWVYHSPPHPLWRVFWKDSWLFVLLAGVGMGAVGWGMWRQRRVDQVGMILSFVVLGWLAGLWWIIPVADVQFFLIPLPFMALLAARGLKEIAVALPKPIALPVVMGVLLMATFPPAATIWNRSQRAKSSLVTKRALLAIELTRPTDSVLDGWTGIGVFRPQAWYYGFVHREIPPMIPQADREALMRDLESGRMQPKIIAEDRALLGLHPRLEQWVQAHYAFSSELGAFIRLPLDKPRSDSLVPAGQPVAASLNTESRAP